MQWFPLAFCMIVFRHTVGLLWTSDQPVSEASTCTGQHSIETQETNIHALSGIRTRDSIAHSMSIILFSREMRSNPCSSYERVRVTVRVLATVTASNKNNLFDN
jgi:hypothetical protein